MRKACTLIAALVALLPTLLKASDAPPPGLAPLVGFLNEVNSLEANFRQIVLSPEDELIEESTGRVWLQRPGRFRWNYSEPFERVIVADGERLWLYEADLEQVTIRPLSAGLGATPAALLTGDAGVLDQFVYAGRSQRDGIDWITLRPREADADFDAITLGFDGRELASLALSDRLGQKTLVDLSAVTKNPPLPEERFRFEVPEGVDVIGNGTP